MKRKQVIRVPKPDQLSVADALIVMNQTIVVTMVLLKDTDPNEAYDQWTEYKDQILACVQVVGAILAQYGEQLDLLSLSLPDGLGMGGYKVDDVDFSGKHDGLPF